MISVGAMRVDAGATLPWGGGSDVSGVPELWIELSSQFAAAGFVSPTGSAGILWDPAQKRTLPHQAVNLSCVLEK